MMLITKLKSIFFLLLLFCWNQTFCQKADYPPNQILIKLKANRTVAAKAQLKNQIRATSLKTYQRLDVELWEFDPVENNVESLIKTYRNHPDVAYVEPNYYVSINDFIPDDPLFSAQWGLHNYGQEGGRIDADIDAPEAWEMTTDASSIVVAIIDTGIDWKHADLVDNIWQNLGEDADGDGHVLECINGIWQFDPGDINDVDDDNNGYTNDFIGWDFVNNDNNPYDDNSHGTHVAGTIGAVGNNGIGVAGVCHDVQLAALKFITANGGGIIADAAEALEYALDMGMPISNNSWGGGLWSACFRDALALSVSENHLFIAAGGNGDGVGIGQNIDQRAHWPAAYGYENIIAVAALNRKDLLWGSSNYGQNTIDISAPGDSIISCLPYNSYGLKSGTSMAAPHVAGVCALLWQANPNKTAAEIKATVLNAADPIPALENISVSGGRVNLYKALEYCEGGSCREPDSLTLVTLYHATEGAYWNNPWNLSDPVNTWHGVETNTLGCVTSLNLSGNNLRGVLPEALADLQYLVTLDLSNNKFTFDDLNVLPELTVIDLIYTPQDSIPTWAMEIMLSVDAGGLISNNIYTWYRNNTLVASDTSGNTYTPDVAGWYHCEITNSLVTNPNISEQNLLLTSEAVYVDPALSGRARDSLILVELYHATNGSSWTNTWTLSMPMDNWFGVSLNQDGRVTCLDLDGNGNCSVNELPAGTNLSGTLPFSIGNLNFLEKLFLQNNTLTGAIPASLGKLTRLSELYLNDNEFSYKIPESFGNLNDLKKLYLENNNLRGVLPESLGNLTALRWLYCNGNNLTGSIPATLGTLSNIMLMRLDDNNLTGSIPSSLGNLTTLQSLYLSDNNLTGSIPASFTNLTNLNRLDIDQNRFTFAGMEIFPSLGFSNIHYAPQDSIPVYNIVSNLYVKAGGTISNNHYTWYKNDTLEITIAGDSTYTPSSEGWYRCVVTNDLVTISALAYKNLMLQSRSVYFTPEAVWPGDFNNDGIANNNDLLYWGLAADSIGPARLNPTINWEEQDGDNWSNLIYNINGKHQDANGDGIVDADDLAALNLNYGKVHNYAPPVLSVSSDAYEIVALEPTTVGHLRYGIAFDNPDDSTPTMHGFSCTVYLGSLPVGYAYADTTNSCLAPDEYISEYDATDNKLDIALTRTDKTNVSCNSYVVEFIIITENIIGGEQILVSISGGTTIEAEGAASAIDNASHFSTYSETAPNDGIMLLSANIDHEECDVLGEVVVLIEGGVVPYTVSWNTCATDIVYEASSLQTYSTALSNLIAGTYTATVTDAMGLSKSITVNVEGPLLGCNTSCPSAVTLASAIPTDTYQATVVLESTAMVEEGSTVMFKAGQSILLGAGFEVEVGAEFEAVIESCGEE